ncbi:MAG: transposase [Ignavibacterium sp.]
MPKYTDGVAYHFYNRGAHRMQLFLHQWDYDYCTSLLHKYTKKYSVSLLAYCLMPNHYHLILAQQPTGSITRCIQSLFNAYVQGFNKLHRHSGTLFQGTARHRHIDSDEYAVHVVRYVHLNPVRAGIVNRAEDWRHSDCIDWISDSGPHESIEFRRRFFENGRDYREFINEYAPERDKAGIMKYLF